MKPFFAAKEPMKEDIGQARRVVERVMRFGSLRQQDVRIGSDGLGEEDCRMTIFVETRAALTVRAAFGGKDAISGARGRQSR